MGAEISGVLSYVTCPAFAGVLREGPFSFVRWIKRGERGSTKDISRIPPDQTPWFSAEDRGSVIFVHRAPVRRSISSM